MNRHRALKWTTLTLALAASLWLAATSMAGPRQDAANANLAFNKLQTLVGHWEAKTDKGTVSTTFRLVSGGSTLLETMDMPGGNEMITAYYLDQNRLLLTHYCESGNQPRMQASSFDPKSNRIDFQFLDATNLPNPDAAHMHQVSITFGTSGEVMESWTFYKGGKAGSTAPLSYHRVD
ncbi:MAG: hypothetical protein ACRD4M_03165 [Candidatus Acidiferrales bacterium]